VEPTGDALDRLDGVVRAVGTANEVLPEGPEREAVVRSLLDRLFDDWPGDVPLAGVR
jgi:hypothetical protein